MAQTSITVDLATQVVGELPNANLPFASSTRAGAVRPDNSTIIIDPLTGTISASGGGGGGTLEPQEQVAGSGTNWTLANTPLDDTEVQLFVRIAGFGASLILQGVGLDYTISGSAITTAIAYGGGTVYARYHF